jgi:hypothetical protein
MYATVPKAPGNQSMASSAVAPPITYALRKLSCPVDIATLEINHTSPRRRAQHFLAVVLISGGTLPAVAFRSHAKEGIGHPGRGLPQSFSNLDQPFAPGACYLPARTVFSGTHPDSEATNTTDCNREFAGIHQSEGAGKV